MLHDYEVLLMLDPELAEGRQEEIVVRTRELVEKGGGTWVGHDPWGRRRLAYPIEKKNDGIYHLVQFDAEPETLDELSRILKITDGVMRHLPTRRVKGSHGPGRPGPEPVEPVADRTSADRTPEYAGANTRSQAAAPAAAPASTPPATEPEPEPDIAEPAAETEPPPSTEPPSMEEEE